MIDSLVDIVPRVAARAERCAGVNVQIDRVVPRPLHRCRALPRTTLNYASVSFSRFHCLSTSHYLYQENEMWKRYVKCSCSHDGRTWIKIWQKSPTMLQQWTRQYGEWRDEVLHNNKQTSRTVTRLLAVNTRTWLSFIIYKYHKSSQGSCCVIIITSLLFIDPTNKIIKQYGIAISVLALTVDWPKPSEQKGLEVNTTNKHTKYIRYPAKKYKNK